MPLVYDGASLEWPLRRTWEYPHGLSIVVDDTVQMLVAAVFWEVGPSSAFGVHSFDVCVLV